MIPAGGFLVGEAPSTSQVLNYRLPARTTLSYREGAIDFIPRERVPPFLVVAHNTGLFEAALVSGSDGSTFGFRAELRRDGVFGTLLIDRLEFEVAAIQLNIEGCPNTTVEVEETSASVVLTSDEACPQVTVSTEETSVLVLTLADS